MFFLNWLGFLLLIFSVGLFALSAAEVTFDNDSANSDDLAFGNDVLEALPAVNENENTFANGNNCGDCFEDCKNADVGFGKRPVQVAENNKLDNQKDEEDEDYTLVARRELVIAKMAELQAKINHTVSMIHEQLKIRIFLEMLGPNMTDAEARVTSAKWLELKNTIVNQKYQVLLDIAYDLLIYAVGRSAIYQVMEQMKQNDLMSTISSTVFWVQYVFSLVVAGFIGALITDRRRFRVLHCRLAATSSATANLPPVYTGAASVPFAEEADGKDNEAFAV